MPHDMFAFNAKWGSDPDSPTFQQAMTSSEQEYWIEPICAKLAGLTKCKTWIEANVKRELTLFRAPGHLKYSHILMDDSESSKQNSLSEAIGNSRVSIISIHTYLLFCGSLSEPASFWLHYYSSNWCKQIIRMRFHRHFWMKR